MNTKTTKMLAALAVIAVAFAVFAVVAPADDSDAVAVSYSDNDTWSEGGKVLTSETASSIIVANPTTLQEGKVYYISNDSTFTVPARSGNMGAILLLIEEGKTVTLSVTANGAQGAGNIWISAMSVEKTTSGTNTVYTSPTAAGSMWIGTEGNTNKLVYNLPYSGDAGFAVTGMRLGLGAEDAGTFTFHAAADGAYRTIDSSTGSFIYLYEEENTVKGTSKGTHQAIYNGTQTVNFDSFTGPFWTDGGKNKMILTKFTGTMTIDGNNTDAATITAWGSGDVEVVKPAEGTVAVIVSADIPAGSTLYVGAEAYATTKASDTFTNNGTISIKQDATEAPLKVGTFTLTTGLSKFVNKGVISNMGHFVQNGINVENSGRVVTLNDVSATGAEGYANKAGWAVTNTETVKNTGTFTFKETNAVSTVNFTQDSNGAVRNQIAESRNKDISGGITDDTYQTSQSATIKGSATLTGILNLNGLLIVEENSTLVITGSGKISMNAPQAVIINKGTIEVQSKDGITLTKGSIYNYGAFEFANSQPAGNASNNVSAQLGAFVQNFGTMDNQAGVIKLGASSSFINQAGATFVNSANLTTANGAMISNGGALVFNGTVDLGAALEIKLIDKKASVQVIELGMIKDLDLIFTNYLKGAATNSVIVHPEDLTEEKYPILSGLNIATYGTSNYYLIVSGDLSVLDETHAELANGKEIYIGLKGYDVDFKPTGASKDSYANKVYVGDLIVGDHVRLFSGDDGATSGAGNNEANTNFYFVGDSYFDPSATTITKNDYTSALVNGQAFVTGEIVTYKNPLSGFAKINAASYYVTENYNRTYHYTTVAEAIADAAEAGVKLVTISGVNEIASDVIIPGDAFKVQIQNGAVVTIDDGATLMVSDGGILSNSGTIYVNGTLYAYNAKTGITANTSPADIISDVKVLGVTDVEYTNLYKALSDADVGDVVVITKESEVKLSKDTTIKAGVTLDTNETALDTNGKKLTVNGILVLYAVSNFGEWDDVTLNGYIVSDDQKAYSTTNLTGAYYTDEVNNVDYYYIAGIQNLGDITSSGVTSVAVNGDIIAAAIAFAGADSTATVTFNYDVDVGTITASKAKVVFAYGTTVSAIVTDGTNAVKLNGDVPAESNDKKLTVTLGDKFAVAGEFDVSTIDADDFEFAVSGTTSVGALKTYDLTVAGLATAAGNIDVSNDLVVTGTLNVSEDYSIKASSAMVTGTLSSAGSATITDITIGSTTSAVQATAFVGGDGTYTVTTVVLFAGNGVADAIIENMKSSEFYVDGKLWFTVYSKAATVTLADMTVPVTDSKATAIDDADKNLKIDGKKLTGFFTVGKQDYDISVDYEIYKVKIYTDAGVKAVYINGKVMTSPVSGVNSFELDKLEAGTYKVTYTLINGYEGSAQLYTKDGTILKDNSFVLSGTTETEVLLQLSGTEQIVTPEPSPVEQNEWTITTILLVILVILIAIMAVIVALRLNRS